MSSEPTHIGFTGNQIGYDAGAEIGCLGERGRTMYYWLSYLRVHYRHVIGHHGDCIGSDLRFHQQCRSMRIPRIIHPPDNDSKRAFAHLSDGVDYTLSAQNTSVVLPPEPYIERNHAIVDQTVMLLATPKTRAEERRSGTWATIRYARQALRWIVIVWPDGTWSDEGPRPAWFDLHQWDGDTCVRCGFDAVDAMAYREFREAGSDELKVPPLPTCREWSMNG